jgi:hypothetical protein
MITQWPVEITDKHTASWALNMAEVVAVFIAPSETETVSIQVRNDTDLFLVDTGSAADAQSLVRFLSDEMRKCAEAQRRCAEAMETIRERLTPHILDLIWGNPR